MSTEPKIAEVLARKQAGLPQFVHTHPDEQVATAISILREYNVSQLPVMKTEPPVMAAEAMRKVNREARRADIAEAENGRLTVALEESEERAAEAIVRVAELEQDNDVLRAELDTATNWHPPQVRHA